MKGLRSFWQDGRGEITIPIFIILMFSSFLELTGVQRAHLERVFWAVFAEAL